MDFFDELENKNLNRPGTVYSDGINQNNVLVASAEDVARKSITSSLGAGKEFNSLGDPTKFSDVGLQVGENLLNAQEEGKLNNVLADAQSGWQQARNALARTLISEIGIGTARGFSDLFDYTIGGILRAVSNEDNDYINPVSKLLEDAQKSFEEATPIYTKDDSSILNSDSGWWWSNLPSVASSLSLMLPARGISLGAAKLAKLAKSTKIGANLNNATRRFLTRALGKTKYQKAGEMLQYGAEGTMMRIGENYRESRDTYNEMLPEAQNTLGGMSYEEYLDYVNSHKDILGNDIDYNDRNEVAKRIASKAADETFKDDMANVVFDIWQLYGIGRFNRFMKAPMRGDVKRLNALQAKMPNESIESLKQMLKDRTTKQKIWDYTKDAVNTLGFSFTGEFTEGIEEAVNYIAQQEGITYGKALLEKAITDYNKDELNRNTLPFGRVTSEALNKYMSNSELWDSAFWGLAGGVVFSNAADKLNREYTKRVLKNQKREELEKAGVDKDVIAKQLAAFEDPGTKRIEDHFRVRGQQYELYKNRENDIKKGINPFNRQQSLDKDNPEEVALAHKRNVENYWTTVMLDAMDIGYWDTTKAFLASDNLANNLVSEGYMTQEEFEQNREAVLAHADKVENYFNESIDEIENVVSQASDTDLTNVPMELLEIIAKENVTNKIARERLTEEINQLQKENNNIADKKAIKDEINKLGYNPEDLVKTTVQTQILGQLVAEYESIKNDETAATISGQVALDDTKRKINLVRNLLTNRLESDYDYAKYIDALQTAYSTRKNSTENGKPYIFDKDTAEKIDELIVNNNVDELVKLGIYDESLATYLKGKDYTNDILPSVTKLRNSIANLYNDNTSDKFKIRNLKDISNALHDGYREVALKEIELLAVEQEIATTKSDVLSKLDRYNNMLRETAEQAGLEIYVKMLQSIANETKNPDAVINELESITNGNGRTDFYNSLTDDQKKTIDDSARIMNLSAGINKLLKDRVERAIKLYDIIDYTSEKSTVSQNPQNNVSETSVDNSSLSIENISSEPNLRQNKPQNSQRTIQQTSNKAVLNFGVNDINKPTIKLLGTNETNDNAISVSRNTSDDTITLNLVGKQNVPEYIKKSKELFGDTINNTGKITKNPIIQMNDDGTFDVIEEGIISNPANANGFTPSSTGGQADYTADITQDDYENQPKSFSEIMSNVIMSSIQNKEDYDYVKIANRIKQEYGKLPDDDEIKRIYDSLNNFSEYSNLANLQVNKATLEEISDAIKNTVVFSALNDTNPSSEVKEYINKLVNSAIDKVLNGYIKYYGVPTSDGKYAISKEALLLFCDEVVTNLPISDLYDTINNILNTSNKYIVIDNNTDKLDIVNNVTSTEPKEIKRKKYLDRFNNSNTIMVANYLSNLERAINDEEYRRLIGLRNKSANEIKELISRITDIVSNADSTSRLTYKKQEKEKQTGIDFFIDGTKVGEIPRPEYSKTKPDTWEMVNDGWITDIPFTALTTVSGNVDSDFIKFVKRIISPKENDSVGKELQKLFNNAATAKGKSKTKARKDFIDYIRKDENLKNLISDKEQREYVLYSHIESIINYSTVAAALSNNKNKLEAQLNSIDDWGRKLASSYEQATRLLNDSSLEIDVDKVKLVQPNITSDFTPISKAIGEKTSMEIGIVTAKDERNITTIGGRKIRNKYRNKRNTPVLIISEGNNQEIVYVKSQLLGNTPKAEKILKQLRSEFKRLLDEWKEDDSNDNSKIFNFVYSLARNVNNIPLFRGISIQGTNNGFAINIENTNTTIFFNNNKDIVTLRNGERVLLDTNDVHGILKNIQFNFSEDVLFGSNEDISDGILRFGDNNEVIIQIGNEEPIIYQSIEDFIKETDAIHVKTKAENGSNFIPIEKGISLSYKIVDKSSPVEEITNPQPSSIPTDENTENVIKKLIDDNVNVTDSGNVTFNNNVNVSKEILNILLKGIKSDNRYMLSILNNSKIIDELLHKNIIFVPNFNSLYVQKNNKLKEINPAHDAKAAYIKSEQELFDESGNKVLTIPSGTIIVGDAWMDLIRNNKADKYAAARDVLHENLHAVLKESNVEWKNQAKELYDEIVSVMNDKNAVDINGNKLTTTDRNILDAFVKGNSVEEVLVESITRPELMKVLNKIHSSKIMGKVVIKETLLQKIIKLFAKLFGVKINNNSILQKEYELFTKLGEESKVTTNPNIENAVTEIQTYHNWQKEHVTFDEDTHEYSVDGTPVDYSVTQYGDILYGEEEIEGDYSFTQAIGKTVDSLTRDFFDNNVDINKKEYPNLSEERKQQIISDLKRLKEYFNKKYKNQYKVITTEIPLVGTIRTEYGNRSIAGTTDLLVIDKDGNLHIYDMKAKNHSITDKYNGKERNDRRDYTYQLNAYKQLLETVIPAFKGKVKDLHLIWFDQKYPSQNSSITYKTENNIVTVVHENKSEEKIEDFNDWVTPSLKSNISDSLIELDNTQNPLEEVTQITNIPTTNQETRPNDKNLYDVKKIDDSADEEIPMSRKADFAYSSEQAIYDTLNKTTKEWLTKVKNNGLLTIICK